MSKLYIVEGPHEEIFLKDLANKNMIEEDMKPSKIMVVNPNRIHSVAKIIADDHTVEDFPYIIIMYDTDVIKNMSKVKSARVTFEKNGFQTEELKSFPFLETLIASMFSDFTFGGLMGDADQIKEDTKTFLFRKFGLAHSTLVQKENSTKKLKKITLTQAIRRGGSLSNLSRFSREFDIIKYIRTG